MIKTYSPVTVLYRGDVLDTAILVGLVQARVPIGIALQNRKDKDQTRQMVAGADNINSALTNAQPQFKLPRFE